MRSVIKGGVATLVMTLLAVVIAGGVGATNGHGQGGGHTPVTVCHKPGTPAQHTLTFDDDGWKAHIAHGDTLGPCTPLPPECEVDYNGDAEGCGTPPVECEDGQIIVDGQCVTPPIECEEGQELVDGVCVTPEPPVEPPVVVNPPTHDCTFVGADKDGGVDAYGGTNDDCAPFPQPPTTTTTQKPVDNVPAQTATPVTPLPTVVVKPKAKKAKAKKTVVKKHVTPKPDKPPVKSTKVVKVSKANKIGLVTITTSDGKKHTAVMGSG